MSILDNHFVCAKANDLEPSAYIRHVLESIADADTLEKLERLPCVST